MEAPQVAQSLEALGNTTRLEIYRILVRAGDPGIPVGTLQTRTNIPRSTLSHHLHRLIDANLVTQTRQGTTLFCRVNYPHMHAIVDFLTAECCADSPTQADCDRTSTTPVPTHA